MAPRPCILEKLFLILNEEVSKLAETRERRTYLSIYVLNVRYKISRYEFRLLEKYVDKNVGFCLC